MDGSKEPIMKRSTKLSHLIFDPQNYNCSGINRETLLDAMTVLMDESGKEQMKKDKNFGGFVQKFQSSFEQLKNLRVGLSDFEIKNIIGRGHFGEVQVVREKHTGNCYAMKILHKVDTLSQRHVAFYEEERDIMAKSTSPWITQLKYAFQDPSNLYLVMEFHPGGDLLGLLTKYDDILSEKMAEFYLAEMVQAIHSLHNMGYVHRDIKPDNILIDRTGHIKLADFGSAAKLQANGKVSSEMPVGTPDYIAPEVLCAMNGNSFQSAKNAGYGVECDWWSLGIVAYQLLYGDTPFSDDKVITTYSNIMNFKTTLKFPPNDDDYQVSNLAKALISSLLEDAVSRIRYEQLCDHEFFAAVDWNNLMQVVPPFVPTVSGQDDTSNFEEFEKESFHVPLSEFKTKNQFNSNDLPFVGFTYCHNIKPSGRKDSERRLSFHNMSFESSFSESPAKNRLGNMEIQLNSKRKEIKELQTRLSEYEASNSKLETSKNRQTSLESSLKTLQEEKLKLEQTIAGYVNDVASMKKLVDAERNARIANENKACTLVEAIKQKYKEQASIKQVEYERILQEKEAVESELLMEKRKCKQVENSQELLLKELKDSKEAFESVKAKHNKNQTERKDGLEDIHLKLEKLSQNTNQQVANLQAKLHQMEKQKNEAEGKVQELELKMLDLDKPSIAAERNNETCSLKICSKLKKDFQQTQDYCIKLETQLAEINMSDLNSRLNEELKQNDKLRSECAMLEMKLTEYQNTVALNKEVDHSEVKEMEKDLDVKKAKTRLEKANEAKTSGVQDQLNNLHNVQLRLENSVKTLENEAVDSLATFNKEGTDLHQENLYLRTKVTQLESHLGKTGDNCSDRAKLKEMQEKLRKTEEDLNDSNLNLRIKSREVKSLEEKLQWGRETQKDQRKRIQTADETISKLKEAESQSKKSLEELRADLQEKTDAINQLKTSQQTVKAQLDSRIETLRENCGNARTLEEKFAKSQGQYEEVCLQNKDLNSQVKSLQQENANYRKKYEIQKDESRETAQKFENMELSLNVQKSTCKMLEDQIHDCEDIISMLEEVKENLETDVKALKIKINTMTSESIKEKQDYEKVKKERDVKQEMVKELEVEIDTLKAIHKDECDAMEANINELHEQISNLTNQLSDYQKMCSNEQVSAKLANERIKEYDNNILEIKEEAAKHITQISSLKQSNLKLTQALGEALDNYEMAKSELRDLNAEADSAACNYEQERIKMMETIAQQTKLIEFLQQKTEVLQEKRKKGLFGAIKTSSKSETGNPSGNFRDVEHMLKKERQKNRTLMDQVNKARTEVMSYHQNKSSSANNKENGGNHVNKSSIVPTSPKTRAVLTALVSSPNSNIPSESEDDDEAFAMQRQFRDSLRQPQKQRMHHNIPHRFQQFHAMRGIKCSACLDTIHLGRQAMKCQECNVVSHVRCTHAVPSTCGLPAALVDHFTTAVTKGLPSSPSIVVDRGSDLYEGWVKIPCPGKQGWEKRYMQLNDSQLRLYDKENVRTSAIDIFELNVANCEDQCAEIIIAGAVSHSELVNTAKSDIPFILKIEWLSHTTCWPGRSVYFMAESLSQKQLWVIAIESVIKKYSSVPDNISLSSASANSKLLGNTIVEMQKQAVNINCSLVFIDQWLLLGAAEGLFAVDLENQPKSSTAMHGLYHHGSIYQMVLLQTLDMVLFLVGNSRELKVISVNELKSALSSKSSVELNSLWKNDVVTNCHLIAAGSGSAAKTFVAIATTDYLSLYKWDFNAQSFYKTKDFRTTEPCSCIHFGEHTFLFGANKFYEVDLNDYSIEEFLDDSDPSLAYAVFGASQLNSFPMAIVQVSQPDESMEYLLCFHDFGVYVDDFGRKTRSDELKWSKLPLGIAFRAPYLYIVHFASLEICRIPRRAQQQQALCRAFLSVTNPLYLGPAMNGSAVYIAQTDNNQTEVLCIRGNISDDGESKWDKVSMSSSDRDQLNRSTSSNEEENFTFTDSIVASLDGNIENGSTP